jgi:transposase, IS5 family
MLKKKVKKENVEQVKPINLGLNPTNRWVQLAHILPWSDLIEAFEKKINVLENSKEYNSRVVIGTLIIKEKLRISDEEAIQIISENPYMQYFLGLEFYTPEAMSSLLSLIEFSESVDKDVYNELRSYILARASTKISLEKSNKKSDLLGNLKIVQTEAEQHIKFPIDLELVNAAREQTEDIIDLLYDIVRDELPVKPRTYRKVTTQRLNAFLKSGDRSISEARKMLRVLLNCLNRNLLYVDNLLDMLPQEFPLKSSYQKQLWVVHTLFAQQKQMYDENVFNCEDQIIDLDKPNLRPVKQELLGKKIEFGSQLRLTLLDGVTVNKSSSTASSNVDNAELIMQAETYRLLVGVYPQRIEADKSYTSSTSRKWCKKNGIRLMTTVEKVTDKKTAKRLKRKNTSRNKSVEVNVSEKTPIQLLSLNQIKTQLHSTVISFN